VYGVQKPREGLKEIGLLFLRLWSHNPRCQPRMGW